MKRVLVTGASGFVGSALCAGLSSKHAVMAGVRNSKAAARMPAGTDVVVLGDLTTDAAAPDLRNVDVVVHAAGRAHVLGAAGAGDEQFRAVNVRATEQLARRAAEQGVSRFIFISSIGVNGPASGETPFRESDAMRPATAYARSKAEAEERLWQVARETGLDVVVLRPPLVYGPDAPGNFARLVRAVSSGWPLPLGSIQNARSLIYIGNLVDAIATMVSDPRARGELFLVADSEYVSTPTLARMIAAALRRPARVYPCPPGALELFSQLAGKAQEVQQLTGSLIVSTAKLRQQLGWQPPYSLAEALAASVSGTPHAAAVAA